VAGHGAEGLGKLLFIQRQAFPNLYRCGPVVKSNYQKFQVISGDITVIVLGVFLGLPMSFCRSPGKSIMGHGYGREFHERFGKNLRDIEKKTSLVPKENQGRGYKNLQISLKIRFNN
jgi:hypothetical protein